MSDGPLPMSTTLPPSARDRLVRASEVSNEYDPRARQKAIEAATNIIRTQYPEYFHIKEVTPCRQVSK